ncbi:hypothetical protein BH09MYX1_BH09MYX1_17270 [soil metagenome]
MKRSSLVLLPAVLLPLFVVAPAFADDKAECIAASEKAQSLRDEKKFTQTREQLLVCGRDACPAVIKKDCAEQLVDLDKKIPSVVVRAKDKTGNDIVNVKVTIDGKAGGDSLDGRAVQLDPGVHSFKFETAGEDTIEQKVVVAEGEQSRAVTVTFGHPEVGGDTKRGAPIAGIIIGSLGLVAGAIIAPIFWSLGLGQKSTDESAGGCAPAAGGAGCSDDEISSIRTKLAIGDVFLGVGVVGIAVGVVLIVTHYTGGKSTTGQALAPTRSAFTPRVDVSPTRGGGFASVGFDF